MLAYVSCLPYYVEEQSLNHCVQFYVINDFCQSVLLPVMLLCLILHPALVQLSTRIWKLYWAILSGSIRVHPLQHTTQHDHC